MVFMTNATKQETPITIMIVISIVEDDLFNAKNTHIEPAPHKDAILAYN
jgi:hypothetical protein